MNKEDIHIISRHSNWSEKGIEETLKNQVYSSLKSWKKFLQLLFMGLGVGFAVSGILFFFAYNWDDLHKFTKIGMVEGLIIFSTLFAVFSKLKENIKNIILLGSAILVGVLFAVYGQIYQTGANAYDFFLGWTIFVSIWVLISNYPPLWLLFLVLINTTFVLYTQQVAQEWVEEYFLSIVFVFNVLCVIVFHALDYSKSNFKVPNWLANIISLAVVIISTNGISIGIFEEFEKPYLVLLLLAIPAYWGAVIYGLRQKRAFYISIISFSVIVITSSWLVYISDGATMFFVVCLFIIASVTALIKGILTLQKRWKNESE